MMLSVCDDAERLPQKNMQRFRWFNHSADAEKTAVKAAFFCISCVGLILIHPRRRGLLRAACSIASTLAVWSPTSLPPPRNASAMSQRLGALKPLLNVFASF
jgi:hypothetical protein